MTMKINGQAILTLFFQKTHISAERSIHLYLMSTPALYACSIRWTAGLRTRSDILKPSAIQPGDSLQTSYQPADSQYYLFGRNIPDLFFFIP